VQEGDMQTFLPGDVPLFIISASSLQTIKVGLSGELEE
jgi:hypothetical protein